MIGWEFSASCAARDWISTICSSIARISFETRSGHRLHEKPTGRDDPSLGREINGQPHRRRDLFALDPVKSEIFGQMPGQKRDGSDIRPFATLVLGPKNGQEPLSPRAFGRVLKNYPTFGQCRITLLA